MLEGMSCCGWTWFDTRLELWAWEVGVVVLSWSPGIQIGLCISIHDTYVEENNRK